MSVSLTRFARAILLLVPVAAFVSCKETSGPAAAVTLTLYSIDGAVVPVALRTPDGKPATIARGFLQGTNWGHACGFAVGLAEGPLTTVSVPACRIQRDEERIFTITFNDVRFPGGAHQYRFVP